MTWTRPLAVATVLALAGHGAAAQAPASPGAPMLLVPSDTPPSAAAPLSEPMQLVPPAGPEGSPSATVVRPVVPRPSALPQSAPPRPAFPALAGPASPDPETAPKAPVAPEAAVAVPSWRHDGPDFADLPLPPALAETSPPEPAGEDPAAADEPDADVPGTAAPPYGRDVLDTAADDPADTSRDVAAGLPPIHLPAPADVPPPVSYEVLPLALPTAPGIPDGAGEGPRPQGVAAGLPPVAAPPPADLPIVPMAYPPTWATDDTAGEDSPPPQEAPVRPPPLEPRGEASPPGEAPETATADPSSTAADSAGDAATSGDATPIADGIRALLDRFQHVPAPATEEAVVSDDTLAVPRGFPGPPSLPTAAPPMPAPPAAVPAETPVRLVRRLQQLQDQMAAGAAGSVRRQRELLDEIEAAFASAPAATWDEAANAHALVTFVLSGGNPAPLRTVLGRAQPSPIDVRLMRGALAYVEGREDEAAAQLADVEVRAVPPSMGAQLALAKAALAVSTDPALAVGLLDTARLLAPGTLAEEAALRREIFVVAQRGDVEKFELLSTQYLSRFRHSVYAGNFRQRFAAALTRMEFIGDPRQAGRLDDMVADLDTESRRDIYLLVARAAVNRGLTSAATFAAERALALADPQSIEAARARLYRAAVLVVTPAGLDEGLADLAAVDVDRLPPDDAALHHAASSTAGLILTAPDLPAPSGPRPASPSTVADLPGAVPPPPSGAEAESAVADRARRALAAVDDLLKETAR